MPGRSCLPGTRIALPGASLACASIWAACSRPRRSGAVEAAAAVEGGRSPRSLSKARHDIARKEAHRGKRGGVRHRIEIDLERGMLEPAELVLHAGDRPGDLVG